MPLLIQCMSADQRLTQFLKEGKDWERKATSIPGIFLLRLPGQSP
jgi:hypothetical protein